MARNPVPLVLALVAALFFLAAGAAFYASEAHAYTYRNAVSLAAPDGVVWVLWVPRGPRAMDVEAAGGNVTLAGVVQTSHGTYSNLSGTGNASVQWVTRWATYFLGPFEYDQFNALVCGYTGQSNPIGPFYLWMNVSVPGSSLEVRGTVDIQEENLAQHASDHALYAGTLVEGWNKVYVLEGHNGWSGWDGSSALLFEGLAVVVPFLCGAVFLAAFNTQRRKVPERS